MMVFKIDKSLEINPIGLRIFEIENNLKSHLLTLKEFKKVARRKIDRCIESGLLEDPGENKIRIIHTALIYVAIDQGREIPISVLKEYQMDRNLFKPIKKYCSQRNISF